MLTCASRKISLERWNGRSEDCFLKTKEKAYQAPTKGFSRASPVMAMLFAPFR